VVDDGETIDETETPMADLPDHEERAIRDYVDSQSPADDRAELVQKVGSHRVLGHVHEVYDVHCTSTRWWVMTNPTNLYLQSDFPQAEQALIFHIGLGAFMAERSRAELDEDAEEHVSSSWRRFRQALEAMDEASESEDFQAVGIKCRDALIALGKSHMDAPWLGEVPGAPKAADFKGWASIYAERLTDGRMRNYLKALADKTWDLTVWLQHYSNATPVDADIVLEATAHLIGTFGKVIRRREAGEPERCPRCESYQLAEDIQHDAEQRGFFASTVCGACGWRSDVDFTPWAEHFEGSDIEGYLSSPGLGISDRLHPEGDDSAG
tara:strand:- start:2634 stop:3605 length:972 start_codon:yes stop_codon:yes gene_type:complete